MHSWMTVHIRYSTWLRFGQLGGHMSSVKSGVLCHSSSVLLCMRGAMESKSHQQLDRCIAATVWAARHHNSPTDHSLLPLAAWKPRHCTSAWRHRLKPKRRNMFITKERGYVHELKWQLIEIWTATSRAYWSIDRSVTRLFYCLKAKSKHFEHLLWCVSLWYVTVMTFKAYTTAVRNKLTYVRFTK